jgi:hypothetical protein
VDFVWLLRRSGEFIRSATVCGADLSPDAEPAYGVVNICQTSLPGPFPRVLMSHDNTDLTRRDFAKAAVAAVAVPVLAPLAACTPTAPPPGPAPSSTPAAGAMPDSAAAAPRSQEPTPLARALAEAVRVQYGDRMTEAEMARVQRGISGILQTAERLRAFPLPIATEPTFAYRVPGGTA